MKPEGVHKAAGLVLFIALIVSVVQASESTLLSHLRYLASDELKGRSNGSPELNQAAQYIANEFHKNGLLPAGNNQTYFQEFEVSLGRELGQHNEIVFERNGEQVFLKAGADFLPLTSDSRTIAQGKLVFAGYGISAPELNYDDYQGVDVRGKIVLAFEHEPQEHSESSPFAGTELTPYATELYKISNARSHGAVGIILIPDSFNHPENENHMPPMREVQEIGIHAVKLAETWGFQLLRESGRDPGVIIRWLDEQLTPYSFDLDARATLSLDVVKVRRRVKNVLGLIPGRTNKVLLIGAHYDHLGLGNQTSLAPEHIGEIHNGADDNASGTAGMLELARGYAGTWPRYGLLFIAFAGEELGLLGSHYYTEHPTLPLKETVAMLNLDMIGRSDGNLLIGGVESATEFNSILSQLDRDSPLRFSYSENFRGSSDHLVFALKRIPVLFFFSGLHSDYHRPTDDWQKIDLIRTGQVLDVVRGMIGALQNLDSLHYVDTYRQRYLSMRGRGRGFGPRFGSLIDTAWDLGGVRFAQVLRGSPAAIAGLKDGDVLMEFDGVKIERLHDFISLLSKKKPGDEVPVVVLRNDQLVRTRVRLGSR